MQFELDLEQEQLRDSLVRLLQAQASFERRRQAVATPQGWDVSLWPALGGLGVTALTLPEAHGGFGQRPVALLPVLQALGHSLAVQPFLPSAVMAATAILRAGSQAQQLALLPGIADASRIVVFAHDEPAARQPSLWVETRARCVDGRWRLDGHKHNVLFAAGCSIVVSARDEEQKIRLFLLDPTQPGVHLTPTRLIDDTPAAAIELVGAQAEPLLGDGLAALQAALDAGSAASCGETLGVAQRAYDLTIDYLRTRQQFGRTIGSNQALRHRAAEMHVALDTLRSAAMAGLLALEIEDEPERTRELARARMLASRHGTFITQQAIQLHGGIGMTIEYAVGHCLRRMAVLDALFGDGAAHAARLGASLAVQIVASDEGRAALAA
ncbi:MAG: acyl-CoA dehydrogenase family protein [Burkholderiales bacterium]|nr:acyl-CoA dehydrogenase family protein [Burkholderiales bacterium]